MLLLQQLVDERDGGSVSPPERVRIVELPANVKRAGHAQRAVQRRPSVHIGHTLQFVSRSAANNVGIRALGHVEQVQHASPQNGIVDSVSGLALDLQHRFLDLREKRRERPVCRADHDVVRAARAGTIATVLVFAQEVDERRS